MTAIASKPVLYQPPSPQYIMSLVDQLRDAHRRATTASAAYNAVAAALDETAKITSQRHRDDESTTALKVRYARAGNPDLSDADRQYKFWAGEVERIGMVIQAEYAAMKMMGRA